MWWMAFFPKVFWHKPAFTFWYDLKVYWRQGHGASRTCIHNVAKQQQLPHGSRLLHHDHCHCLIFCIHSFAAFAFPVLQSMHKNVYMSFKMLSLAYHISYLCSYVHSKLNMFKHIYYNIHILLQVILLGSTSCILNRLNKKEYRTGSGSPYLKLESKFNKILYWEKSYDFFLHTIVTFPFYVLPI